MGDLLKLKLGDICQFKAGDAFKKDMQGRSFGNYPFVKVSDMNLAGNEIFITRAGNWVSESDVTERRFTAHQPGSIVFAKIGIALTYNRRRILRLPTIIDNNMMAATPDAKKVNERYFYYLLRTLDFNEISLGSALPYLTKKDLAEIDVALHPLPEQESIDATLSALDDKIELNRRMNEALETMARALFKDWFVDFGPTRAKIEGRDPYLASEIWDLFPDKLDEDGKPVEWKNAPLKEFFSIIGGGTPKTSVEEYWDGEIPWFSVVDTPPKGSVFVTVTDKSITERGLEESSARLIPEGTTIISARGTVGNLAMAAQEMAFNQSCYALRANDRTGDCSVYLAAQHTMAQLQSMAHGSVFSTITRQTFEAVSLPMPSHAVTQAFEAFVEPLFLRIKSNVIETTTLAQARDLLLPKLISGEIRVGDADKFVQEFT